MLKRLVPLMVFCMVLLPNAFAGESVFGGTQYNSGSSSGSNGVLSTKYTHSYQGLGSEWMAQVRMGVGISQLASEGTAIEASEVRESNAEMSLALLIERALMKELSVESGMGLGMQIVKSAPNGMSEFSPRYLHFPLMGRVHFSKEFSLGVGGFGTVPIDDLNGAPREKRLEAIDFGVIASARITVKASKLINWVFEVGAQRGMALLGDTGVNPNHLRAYYGVAGLAAAF